MAALPDNIRQEVIADHLRIQRQRQAVAQASSGEQATTTGSLSGANTAVSANAELSDVAPEFLAALPPDIQEEVLAQQRMQQMQRQVQQNQDALDPASLFAAMPNSLRQQVLSEMDDSQLIALPESLAVEARRLRAQIEHQQAARIAAMQQHLPAYLLGRPHGIHYRMTPRGPNAQNWYAVASQGGPSADVLRNAQVKGNALFDREALTSLLVMFFVDDSKLNTKRLQGIIKNLCYHPPTRDWVIRAFLSILERAQKPAMLLVDQESTTQWPNINLGNTLGARANVFQFPRPHSGKKSTSSSSNSSAITIHPQAVHSICRHVLDTMIVLAKSFPMHFLPSTEADGAEKEDITVSGGKKKMPRSNNESDFFENLMRMDNAFLASKGKGKSASTPRSGAILQQIPSELPKYEHFDNSPVAQLMGLLDQMVVWNNTALVDRVLKLVNSIIVSMPQKKEGKSKRKTFV